METQPSHSKRFEFVIVLLVLLGVGAYFLSQRLSRDSLALILGLACGVGAMLPTLLLGLYVWRREERRRAELAQHAQATPAQPPVIIVAPQALPGSVYGYPYGQQNQAMLIDENGNAVTPAGSSRDFRIVGGEE